MACARHIIGFLVLAWSSSLFIVTNGDSGFYSFSSICTNTTANSCAIVCEAGNELEINQQLDSMWTELQTHECYENGMFLYLKNFDFEETTIQFDWFTETVNVTELTISYNLSTSVSIKPEAFNVPAFRYLRTLVLEHIRAPFVPKNIFSNIKYLAELTIADSEIEFYEKGFLDEVKESLISLNLSEPITRLIPFSLMNITEKPKLTNLHAFQIRQNLNNTITNTTFKGLVKVAQLNLASCNIEVIGPKSFDVISETLLHLVLDDNRLKTLPAGLFTKFIGGFHIIDIGNNPWHCDCNLEEFKSNLQSNIFRGTIECESPNCIAHSPVCSTSFCNRGGESACMDYDDTVENDPVTPNPSDRNGIIVKECYDDLTKSCEEVQIKGQTKIKSLSSEHGEIIIEIDDDYDATMLVVIWFETIKTSDGNNEYYESSEEVSCQSSNSALFRVNGLKADTAYTICLVSKTETTISPLDCLPYYNQTIFDTNDDDIWILEEDKTKVISFVVCGAIASLFFGVAMSFVLIRKNPTWLRGNDRVVRMSKDMNSDVMVMPPEWSRQPSSKQAKDDKPRRFSDISVISSKSYLQNPCNATELYKRKLMEKRNSQNAPDKENQYYLDYLPHKVPPPLPPPNLPSNAAVSQGENYYTDLAFKNNQ